MWALDIMGAPSALISALLARADAKDAHVIAETVRLRRDLPVVDTVTDLTLESALLTATGPT
jgi:hypothetical protein